MLKQVDIKNFRSCSDTTIRFNRTLCALSGRNGVGKSNILNAIEWACKSVIVPDAVRIAPAGNEIRNGVVDGTTKGPFNISVGFELDFIKYSYIYKLNIPKHIHLWTTIAISSVGGLSESLDITTGSGERRELFHRQGASVEMAGRSEPIRIARMTPAIAALRSLLASDDPLWDHVDQIASFFSGIHYYPLDDGPEARDEVSEQEHDDWKFRRDFEKATTTSVALRLVSMWQDDKERFNELLRILGPDGLNVVENVEIALLERMSSVVKAREDTTSSTTLFKPLFKPSVHMGGAGGFYPFSNLSVGTRRVIRIVISMLFDKRSLMLLEQPEDSIHPGLLRKLVDLLRTYSDETQMVFTTHSPDVLDILQPEEILLTTAPQGSTQVRELTSAEIERAKLFLKNEGALSDFLEPLDDP